MQQGGLGKEPAEAKTVSCGEQDFLDRPDLSVCRFVCFCLFVFVCQCVCLQQQRPQLYSRLWRTTFSDGQTPVLTVQLSSKAGFWRKSVGKVWGLSSKQLRTSIGQAVQANQYQWWVVGKDKGSSDSNLQLFHERLKISPKTYNFKSGEKWPSNINEHQGQGGWDWFTAIYSI